MPCPFAAGAGETARLFAPPAAPDPEAVFHVDFARIDPMSNLPGRHDA
jgi:hypothetical protein